jgi:hypothetical protein
MTIMEDHKEKLRAPINHEWHLLSIWLLTTICVFIAGGCAERSSDRPKDEEAAEQQSPAEKQSIPEQAMSLWQRDIEQYRLHTKDPEPTRAQAEEFLRTVQLGMDKCSQNWEEHQAAYEACCKLPNADPWLLNMLAGRAFMSQAWHHRGGEWAYKVAPEGWKLFSENLGKAAKHYAEALKLQAGQPHSRSACRWTCGAPCER